MISPAIKTTDVPMIIISQSIMPIGSTLKNAGTRFMIAICPRKIIAAIPRNPLHPFSRKAECPVENSARCAELMSQCMLHAGRDLCVPLKCDTDAFYRWYGDKLDPETLEPFGKH